MNKEIKNYKIKKEKENRFINLIYDKTLLEFSLFYLILFTLHTIFDSNHNLLSLIDFIIVPLLLILIIRVVKFLNNKEIHKFSIKIFKLIINLTILNLVLYGYTILMSYLTICSDGLCNIYYILNYLIFGLGLTSLITAIIFIILFVKRYFGGNENENKK